MNSEHLIVSVKIADFGISGIEGKNEMVNKNSNLCAPEILEKGRKNEKSNDIYMFGITLGALFYKENFLTFADSATGSLIKRCAESDLSKFRNVCLFYFHLCFIIVLIFFLKEDVGKMVQKCLQHNSKDRYHSFLEIKEQLDKFHKEAIENRKSEDSKIQIVSGSEELIPGDSY